MSRWLDQYNNHTYNNIWESLKNSLGQSEVDDETIVTSVTELARLNKVVSYVDGLLKGIDPELIPLVTWANFSSQATECLNNINGFNSNKDIGFIVNANNHADNLLTYVRPYMVLPEASALALVKSVRKYVETVDNYSSRYKGEASKIIEDLKGIEGDVELKASLINQSSEEIKGFLLELFGDDDSSGYRREVNDLIDKLGEEGGRISEFHRQLLVGDEDNESLKKSVLESVDGVKENQNYTDKMTDYLEAHSVDLKIFHGKVFGVNDEDGKEITKGIKSEVDDRISQLDSYEVKQKTKHGALVEEIESLLPGATSAGLATAYKEMKESFDAPIRNSSIVFYFSMAGLFVTSLVSSVDSIGLSGVEFIQMDDWDYILKNMMSKVSFYVPILWLAFYGSKRRSESQRLQQEYAHKEALAKSYNSFKAQIEELGEEDKEVLKKLIGSTIDAVSDNASKTLDHKHGDALPSQSILEKIAELAAKNK